MGLDDALRQPGRPRRVHHPQRAVGSDRPCRSLWSRGGDAAVEADDSAPRTAHCPRHLFVSSFRQYDICADVVEHPAPTRDRTSGVDGNVGSAEPEDREHRRSQPNVAVQQGRDSAAARSACGCDDSRDALRLVIQLTICRRVAATDDRGARSVCLGDALEAPEYGALHFAAHEWLPSRHILPAIRINRRSAHRHPVRSARVVLGP